MTTTRPTTLPTTQRAAVAKWAEITGHATIASAKKPRPSPRFWRHRRSPDRKSGLDGSAAVTPRSSTSKVRSWQLRHIDAERMEFYQSDPKAKAHGHSVPGRMLTVDNRARRIASSADPRAAGRRSHEHARQARVPMDKSLTYEQSRSR